MNIVSAKFVKGILGSDSALRNSLPQVAFIGRSNVGKSSIINSLAKKKDLARTSSSPGRTQEINLYLINNACYFLDLPGYGYAKASKVARGELEKLIHGYLFRSEYHPKVVLVIDGNTGPTKLDLEMARLLREHGKDFLVVANKIDKVKRSVYRKQLEDIQREIGDCNVIPYSAEKRIGVKELLAEIL